MHISHRDTFMSSDNDLVHILPGADVLLILGHLFLICGHYFWYVVTEILMPSHGHVYHKEHT